MKELHKLHIRGDPIRIPPIVLKFLEQQARQESWQLWEKGVYELPIGSASITLFIHTINEPLAKIELRQIENVNWVSLKWDSLPGEMDRVFDDLVLELREKCREVKIVTP